MGMGIGTDICIDILFCSIRILFWSTYRGAWFGPRASLQLHRFPQLNPQLPTDAHTRRHPARFVLLGFRIVTLASGGISCRLQGPSFSLSDTGNWRTVRFAEFEYRKSNSPQVLRSLRVYSPQMGCSIHNLRGTDSLVIKHFVARQLELLLCNICTTQIFACPPAEGSANRTNIIIASRK
jgi:hypothetical protein